MMIRIMMATAVAALVSVPAYAQFAPAPGTGDTQANRAAPTQLHRGVPHRRSARQAYASFAGPGGRDAAIRDCVAASSKTYAIRDSNWSISAYRACMTDHGQPE